MENNKEIKSKTEIVLKWLKDNLFYNPLSSVVTLLIIYGVVSILIPSFQWLFVDSLLNGDAEACRKVEGACLAFLKEKMRYIILGMYPQDEHWRPIFNIVLYLFLLVFSRDRSRWGKKLLCIWFFFGVFSFFLMRGGIFGLQLVETDKWSGLPLTLMLATVAIAVSYPVGILLALGRRSKMGVIRLLSVGYIELIRGVPLISILFMSSVMFPLFLPKGIVIDKLLRAQVAIIMFISAYMAEVIRGGLQAIPNGQYEASDALGLNYFQKVRLVILPQALKIVIPPTVNTSISMFKDTSLVMIIALQDMMYTTKGAMSDPYWLGFSVESYIFMAVLYFCFCFSLGKYSRRLEKELDTGLA